MALLLLLHDKMNRQARQRGRSGPDTSRDEEKRQYLLNYILASSLHVFLFYLSQSCPAHFSLNKYTGNRNKPCSYMCVLIVMQSCSFAAIIKSDGYD